MKILVLKNTLIDITRSLSEATAFFMKHNIFVEFTIQDVNIPVSVHKYLERQGFSPTTGLPAKVGYFGLDDYVEINIRNKVAEGLYEIVIFAWDLDTIKPVPDGVITSFTMPNSIYQNTEYIQLAINQYIKDNNGITNRISHEIMHSLCYKASKAGIFYTDEMDKTHMGLDFYKNDNPNAVDGNYALTFANLKPFLDGYKPRSVVLTRNSDDGVQTLGTLAYGGFNCKTLERPWKNNQSNVSCIPIGTYNVNWTFSLRFLKYTYEVQNVKGRSGIRLHSGNYFFDIQGCILLGDRYGNLNVDKEVDILNSKVTIKKFEDLMQKRSFTLIVR